MLYGSCTCELVSPVSPDFLALFDFTYSSDRRLKTDHRFMSVGQSSNKCVMIKLHEAPWFFFFVSLLHPLRRLDGSSSTMSAGRYVSVLLY